MLIGFRWSSFLLRPLLTVGVFGAFNLIAMRVATRQTLPTVANSPGTPSVTVNAKALDFGCVSPTDAFRWVVPLKNATGSDLEISGFNRSCLCTEIHPKSLTLRAGKTRAPS
jgi:hypothetical protein